jgi:hypothetical protein
MTGSRTASKDEMMLAAVQRFGGELVIKGTEKNPQTKYAFLGRLYGSGDFEHIADSMGAYLALRNGMLVKMFG